MTEIVKSWLATSIVYNALQSDLDGNDDDDNNFDREREREKKNEEANMSARRWPPLYFNSLNFLLLDRLYILSTL